MVESLQERINDTLAEFYKEEKSVPVARVRTLRPVEESVQAIIERGGVAETEAQRLRRIHGGRKLGTELFVAVAIDVKYMVDSCKETNVSFPSSRYPRPPSRLGCCYPFRVGWT